jgi:deoxyribonuclease-4
MADRLRFGPAGMPLGFKVLKLTVDEMPKYLYNQGLDSFDYQMVRWGPKPQIKREMAEKLGKNAEEYDVWLTAHGSYFINLTAKENQVLEASKKGCLLALLVLIGWALT